MATVFENLSKCGGRHCCASASDNIVTNVFGGAGTLFLALEALFFERWIQTRAHSAPSLKLRMGGRSEIVPDRAIIPRVKVYTAMLSKREISTSFC